MRGASLKDCDVLQTANGLDDRDKKAKQACAHKETASRGRSPWSTERQRPYVALAARGAPGGEGAQCASSSRQQHARARPVFGRELACESAVTPFQRPARRVTSAIITCYA
jgi:hypothetical protein